MDDLKIRKIDLNDIDEILKISTNVKEFQVDPEVLGFWSKTQFLNWVKSTSDVCLLAENDGKIVGFILFALHVPTGKINFENAWIHKDYRSKGIFENLFAEGVYLAKKLGGTYICALTKIDNIASINALKKTGFIEGYEFKWMHRLL